MSEEEYDDDFEEIPEEITEQEDEEDEQQETAILPDRKEERQVRDKPIVVTGKDRQTPKFMSLNAFVRVVACRMRQMEKGSATYAQLPPGRLLSIEHLAQLEIVQKNCPLRVRRKIGNFIEKFDVNEMELTGRCIQNIDQAVWGVVGELNHEEILKNL